MTYSLSPLRTQSLSQMIVEGPEPSLRFIAGMIASEAIRSNPTAVTTLWPMQYKASAPLKLPGISLPRGQWIRHFVTEMSRGSMEMKEMNR